MELLELGDPSYPTDKTFDSIDNKTKMRREGQTIIAIFPIQIFHR